MKTKYEHFKATFGSKPFLPEMQTSEHESKVNPAGLDPVGNAGDGDLPLKLGPAGSLTSGRIFDMKIASASPISSSTLRAAINGKARRRGT